MFSAASTVFQRFSSGHSTCWLVSSDEVGHFASLGVQARRLSPSDAVLVVRAWCGDSAPWGLGPARPRSDAQLDDLLAAIRHEAVVVYEEHRFVGLQAGPPAGVDLCSLAPEPAPEPSHWVEVRLHDEHGEPRADEPYRVVLADDTELEGRLDADGVARIPGVPPGPCQWFFPSLQPGEWGRARA